MKIKTNFQHWNTTELREWIGVINSYSFLNINNANTYIEALKELHSRKDGKFEN